MIGQNKLLGDLNNLIETGRFPRFSILVGGKGSGKKTVARILCKKISDGLYEESGIKIDDIREIISDAYKIHSLAVYLIPDADNMSVAAKNALLKVTEEPPNNSYFIMTLEDENNTLETIRSRATIFHMDIYTPDEIYQYVKQKLATLHDNEWDIIKEICETPGDVNILGKYPIEFYNYAELVVDNIAEVSGANSFKIAQKVSLKEGEEGYDLKLFWKLIESIMIQRVKQNIDEVERYCEGYSITNKYLKQLRIKSVNRQMLMDMWILDIREAWL